MRDEVEEKDQRLHEYEDLIAEMRRSRETAEEDKNEEETESFQLDVSEFHVMIVTNPLVSSNC